MEARKGNARRNRRINRAIDTGEMPTQQEMMGAGCLAVALVLFVILVVINGAGI